MGLRSSRTANHCKFSLECAPHSLLEKLPYCVSVHSSSQMIPRNGQDPYIAKIGYGVHSVTWSIIGSALRPLCLGEPWMRIPQSGTITTVRIHTYRVCTVLIYHRNHAQPSPSARLVGFSGESGFGVREHDTQPLPWASFFPHFLVTQQESGPAEQPHRQSL